MNKTIRMALLPAFCLSLAGCGASEGGFSLWSLLFGLFALCFLALAVTRTLSVIRYNSRRRKGRKKRKLDGITYILYGAAALMLLLTFASGASGGEEKPGPSDGSTGSTEGTTAPTEVTTVPTEPPVLFVPHKTESTDPSNWGILWEIFEGGVQVENYERSQPISFGAPEEYYTGEGIITFRGNNYRNSATYGTAKVENKKLSTAWTVKTGTLPGSTWSGSGWTGQPLIVRWDDATKQVMNLYSAKKEKADLVEVIYATLEGKIYFLDLEDGSFTRDPITVGMCFKGAGALDPRGYPIMYVGSGDENSQGKRPRMFIISLIDGSILYEYGHNETLARREDNDRWCAFDSSPLVHADSDTLIWPGENGLLYTIKLNTAYDPAAGKLSIDPDEPVLTRYDTDRSSKAKYWYGYEASVNIVENYLYVSENGGMFYCVDLNTMELVWAQDTMDDSNSTPVFQRISEEEGYIYTAPSLHWTQNENAQGNISIYKLNALTGEIVWEKPYFVHTISGVSGGIQSSPLLGKEGTDIEGLIIYTISRIPDQYTGYMVALDTKTGEEVWRLTMDYYAWSSPVAFYDEGGSAYVVIGDSGGYATLVDGATGKKLHRISLGGLVEASPAVFEDMLVVGTRKENIVGVKID